MATATKQPMLINDYCEAVTLINSYCFEAFKNDSPYFIMVKNTFVQERFGI